jgi:hypothetical protein
MPQSSRLTDLRVIGLWIVMPSGGDLRTNISSKFCQEKK